MKSQHNDKEFKKLIKEAKTLNFSIKDKGNLKFFITSPDKTKSYLFHAGKLGVGPLKSFIKKWK